MEVIYLFHSGVAVKTANHLLIFDYYIDYPRGAGFSKGVVSPKEIAEENVVVFVSHKHADHFNRRIFSWKKDVPNIRYILSDNVKTKEADYRMAPEERLELEDITVTALRSTDEGAAFLVEVDGVVIYHAGDLNWWYLEEKSLEYNKKMEEDYCREIDKLKNTSIDLAFVPVDPRLEAGYLKGLSYFMKTVPVSHVVPIHFGENTEVFDWLAEDPEADPWRDKLILFKKRGQRVLLGDSLKEK